MLKPLISVILVNWNTRDLTIKCIESIKNDLKNISHEIIVVDNASMDGSADAFEKYFKDIILIRNKKNYGFSKGNNIGIKKCIGEYICLVNTDIEVIPGCFNELLKLISKDPIIGIVAPQALNKDGTIQITARREVSITSTLFRIFGIDYLFPKITFHSNKKTETIDVAAGCFWMIRKSAIEAVGYLDEDFFFYGEDRDYCKRMRNNGWKIMYHPLAKVYHYSGKSSSGNKYKYYLQLEYANIKYWKKYNNGITVSCYLILRIIYHLVRFLVNFMLFALSCYMVSSYRIKAIRSFYCIRMLICRKKYELEMLFT